MSRRQKPGAGSDAAYLPLEYIKPWNDLIDELAACLADDKRSRQFLPGLIDAARAGKYWPTKCYGDELLLNGFCDLVRSFTWATDTRRAWLGDLLQVLKDGVEGPIGLCSPPRPKTAPEPAAKPPTGPLPPGPGQPGFRRDIDG